MRRKVGIVKKLFTLLLIFLLSINSFAAIVSDNDGSAFITKAEFDALKSSFQSQIDNYNQSIDSKIDGAIASYLAGIKMSEWTYDKILNNDWEEVVFQSGSDTPQFRLPFLSLSLMYVGDTPLAGDRVVACGNKLFWFLLEAKINSYFPTNGRSTRPLFGVLSGSENDEPNIVPYWRGISENWQEHIFCTYEKSAQYYDLAYLEDGTWGPKAKIIAYNAFKFNYHGYNNNAQNPTNVYTVTSKYLHTTDNVNYHETNEQSTRQVSAQYTNQISLDDYNGKQISKPHLVNITNSTWYLSNENFINTFYQTSLNPYNTQDLYNNSTKTVTKRYAGSYVTNGLDINANLKNINAAELYSFEYINGTEKVSTLGMISPRFAEDIYQNSYQGTKVVPFEGQNFNVINPKLTQGFQLCVGKADTVFTWNVEIKDINETSNPTEADIYLSYVPFTVPGNSTEFVQIDGTTQNYVTTINKKATLKWKQTRDATVYVMIKPHFSAGYSPSSYWTVTLDLSGDSKQIMYTTSN